MGGFASFIEQSRFDRPLLSKITDLTITAKIDNLEQQSEARWRLWLIDIDHNALGYWLFTLQPYRCWFYNCACPRWRIANSNWICASDCLMAFE